MKRCQQILATITLLLCMHGCHAETGWQTGDLIFLDLKCGALCTAIEKTTQEQFGMSGPALSHVGMVIQRGKETLVLEAYVDGVSLTPLERFLARPQDTPPKTLSGHTFMGDVPTARIEQIIPRYLGLPYDERFEKDNGAFYCSELIADIVRELHGSADIFTLSPMTFQSKDASVRNTWSDYFQKLGIPLPEGKSGISPLGLWLQAHALQARGGQ